PPPDAAARGDLGEDRADPRGLAAAHHALAVTGDRAFVVPVDEPAGDVAALRLAAHGVAGPLPALLALHLGGEVGQRQRYLVERRVERALAVLEVKEHPGAGVDDALERVTGLDLLAAQARLLGHDEHV